MRGCTAVVHFAAESHVDRSIYEPAPVIATNVTGTFLSCRWRVSCTSIDSSISQPMKCTATCPGGIRDRGISVAAEQSVFRLQGGFGSAGSLLRSHVRFSSRDHAFLE